MKIEDTRWQEIRTIHKSYHFFYRILGGITLVSIGVVVGWLIFSDKESFGANLFTDGLSIIVTVFVLDQLAQRRETRWLKTQLIHEMSSRHNPTALQAVEKLRVFGWLDDGSLRYRELNHADLQGADLALADLRGAHLYKANLSLADLRKSDLQSAALEDANLQQANMRRANLKDAHVSIEQLAQAHSLMGVTMPDGSLYNGCLNLSGDIERATEEGVNINQSEDFARWYGVSEAQYLGGQSNNNV